MLWIEKLPSDHKLLFHGAKRIIEGPLNVHVGRINNDFGQGFYTGETYAQAISFVEYSGVAEPCFPLKEPPIIPVMRANLSANESQ